jgi:hypothetical protein
MSDGSGGIREPLSDSDEYEPYDYVLPPRAPKPWWLCRSFVVPVMVFGITALLAAIGISRLGPIEQPKPLPQNEAQAPLPPKQQDDPLPDEPVKPIESFKSLVLDAAQSYFATGALPVATKPPANSGNSQKTQ